jgi:hypothetical protein
MATSCARFLHGQQLDQPQADMQPLPTPLAMKAQAMRPLEESQEPKTRQDDAQDDCTGDSPDEEAEADDSELDESELQDLDDGRWDVFLLDDGEPHPEYGDFWFPD